MAILSIVSCDSVFFMCGFAIRHGLDKKVFKVRRAPWPIYLSILQDTILFAVPVLDFKQLVNWVQN